ncbi:unnamed protein product [Caenorhabditis brenneri]
MNRVAPITSKIPKEINTEIKDNHATAKKCCHFIDVVECLLLAPGYYYLCAYTGTIVFPLIFLLFLGLIEVLGYLFQYFIRRLILEGTYRSMFRALSYSLYLHLGRFIFYVLESVIMVYWLVHASDGALGDYLAGYAILLGILQVLNFIASWVMRGHIFDLLNDLERTRDTRTSRYY